ncbi:hypothetical protein BO70DRAFT_358038 [Aspergillus heteromorphus CBS 117.55]|uniref:RRM domain-containing protein n=1 Tax=Aspergillus heteromorphus CBS 117.55 TaxID=1448321 RepID=A0A317X404_9EURO|nr:uncharacterized protein BO70DRAFT_358038 [Aspergillus heteromorphus CBS 117.55]PWY92911.1 hypothetical protein BO70DRAFT_358038 [Aspergillus heteromorphus CBS 117.55]
MAAARALKLEKSYGTPPSAPAVDAFSDKSSDKGSAFKARVESPVNTAGDDWAVSNDTHNDFVSSGKTVSKSTTADNDWTASKTTVDDITVSHDAHNYLASSGKTVSKSTTTAGNDWTASKTTVDTTGDDWNVAKYTDDTASDEWTMAKSTVDTAGDEWTVSGDIKNDFATSGKAGIKSTVDTAADDWIVSKDVKHDFISASKSPIDTAGDDRTVSKDVKYDFAPSGKTAFGGSGNNTDAKGLGVKVDAPKTEKVSGVTSGLVSRNVTVDTTSTHHANSGVMTPSHSTEEDREHLTTFKSWGTPAARDKPASRVRRIIIKGLPAAWCNPAKILSLVHGGTVESIHVTPTGTAHILFCEHEACKAFYDKYPNGIDLDKQRKITVFVDMGQDVDVISSQLSFNLSVGATRAVRAVGVGLDVPMGQLYSIAGGNGRKVEKIVESYVPGEARNVVFRFCSIEDAVRFRAALVRNADYEHCNIQYAADPCEIASGYHAD